MKKILLATDGSKTSLDAARFLAHLPHDETIELTVATVVYVPGTNRTYLAGDWIESCMARERQSADDAFAEVESLFEGADIKLRQIVREGNPGETVVAIAQEIQPELLVIGATGHSAIARILLGSTSDYVATHAPCSVLVVRPGERHDENHRLRVAIGYEESGPAQAAIEEFAEFDWAGNTEVRVVSICEEPGFFDTSGQLPSSEFVETAAKQLHDVAPTAQGRLVSFNHAGEGLVHYIHTHHVDLVVLGETPRTRLGRVLMGSMTRFVLRHAPCSVWITRNRMIRGTKKPSHSRSAIA